MMINYESFTASDIFYDKYRNIYVFITALNLGFGLPGNHEKKCYNIDYITVNHPLNQS